VAKPDQDKASVPSRFELMQALKDQERRRRRRKEVRKASAGRAVWQAGCCRRRGRGRGWELRPAPGPNGRALCASGAVGPDLCAAGPGGGRGCGGSRGLAAASQPALAALEAVPCLEGDRQADRGAGK
ncbi:unnamed protein product, partial [Effrenium voratum]